MCNPLFAAFLGLATGCGVPLAPAGLLAPSDPSLAATFHPPSAPTAGLKRYAPVEANADWGGDGSAPRPAKPRDGGAMTRGTSFRGTKQHGMSMPGMNMNMPGIGGR